MVAASADEVKRESCQTSDVDVNYRAGPKSSYPRMKMTLAMNREQKLQEGRCQRAGVEAVVYCKWGRRDLRSNGCPGGWRQMTHEYLQFRSGVVDEQTIIKAIV
ncbi:hypothetical protein B296_00008112 [Ensete ventricosum]|uniref:Uncharacterized protein n=1 Tax=Ensete ventricosum TaxID=4639 RepID=A0A427AMZ3_ENSVE|nr:hypothetical protein B296_00008112 [Ensete ventricosum]